MPLVTFVKRYEREFRLPLYRILRDKLLCHGIAFNLIIGQPDTYEERNIKDILKSNPFGPTVRNRYLHFGRRFLSFQNVLAHVKNSALVIVQQSNSEVLNFLLLAKRSFLLKPKLAYWGHGINFQADNSDSLAQRFKLWHSIYVDHWFAYTTMTSNILLANGYPEERITVLNNTIDVTSERMLYDSIAASDVDATRLRYGIEDGDKVGIFCGSLYKLKGIDFLLRSVELVKSRFSRFHFFVLGSGVMENAIRSFEKDNSQWFHYCGFVSGREKQIYFRLADVQLITGVVGLNIIDSFYSQTPLITTDNPLHSPEIVYLQHGRNGIITGNTLGEYVDGVVATISDEDTLVRLKQRCLEDSAKYTIADMADRFCNGILQTLDKR